MFSLCKYILVEASLCLLYNKIQYGGKIELQLQHEAKSSAVFAIPPTASAIFYHAA